MDAFFVEMMTYPLSSSSAEELARQMGPIKDEIIPELIQALQGPDSPFRTNAAEILLRMRDYRSFVPVMAFVEKEGYAIRFKQNIPAIAQSVQAQNDQTRRQFIDAVEAFLQKKPSQPKQGTFKYQCVLTIIELVRILGDPLAVPLLEKQLAGGGYDNGIVEKVLIALAEIDAEKGMRALRKQIGVPDANLRIMVEKMEVVRIQKEHLATTGHFSIHVMGKDSFQRRKEMSWSFKWEKGLVYLLFGGRQEDEKRLAGQGQTENEVIEQATRYLACWLYRVSVI